MQELFLTVNTGISHRLLFFFDHVFHNHSNILQTSLVLHIRRFQRLSRVSAYIRKNVNRDHEADANKCFTLMSYVYH